MDRLCAICAAALLLLGCAPDNEDEPAKPTPAPVPAPADAAPPPPADANNPLAGAPSWRPPPRRSERRTLEITLRSTPPGATAAVDGKVIGETPAFWRGQATGRPRQFTFVLPGHAMARYRFVPITNGVVHATLIKLVDEPDAGPK